MIKRDPRPDPSQYSKKSKNINVRVTPGEHKRIKDIAESKGLNITQWVESLIFVKEKK